MLNDNKSYAQQVFKDKESKAYSTHNPFDGTFKFTDEESRIYLKLKDIVSTVLKEFLKVNNIYLLSSNFHLFTSNDAKSTNEEYWHNHYDREKIESSVFTAQIHLSSHYLNLTDGRFQFNDNGALVSIEPRIGISLNPFYFYRLDDQF
jgi:hypothetical protein